ncbi:hypothetical protein AJ78_08391, partial [Emergomyces pasteurianus Ep9510]
MSTTLQKPAASPNPYNDTLEVLWRRAKEKLPFSKKDRADAAEELEEEAAGGDYDTSKSAHSRRREQVVNIPRPGPTDSVYTHSSNHRQRKEQYIKSLEQELLRLRDESSATQSETYQVAEENNILRDIMLAHGIPLPGTTAAPRPEDQWLRDHPMATVSVIGSRGFGQRLQVSVGDSPVQPAQIFPPGFGIPDGPTPEQPIISVVDYSKHVRFSGNNGRPYQPPAADFNGPGRLDASNITAQPIQGSGHPYGLDATQVGVDFVLFMERCCLYHAHQPHNPDEPTGHAFTVLSPILVAAPPMLDDCTSWQIPASELDRLLELSSALKLEGELTPVQMWARIKEHPLFHKLDPDGLRHLSSILITGVQCF